MGHHHHHGRHDGAAEDDRQVDRRLWWSTALNTLITVAEFAGGLLTGSLALLADALHNLSDVAALVLAIGARRLGRRPPNPRFTYGFKRVEVLAAFVNALVLVGVSAFIAWEAFARLSAPRAPDAGPMLAVALVALVGNTASVLLLHRHSRGDINVQSAFLHLAQDALASLIVVVAALFAKTPAGVYLDPLASVVICGFVLRGAFTIVAEAFGIVTEATPRGMDVAALGDGVAARFAPARLHHLHVWEVGPGQRILPGHLAVPEMSVAESEALTCRIRDYLRAEWSIVHATLEPEVNGCGTSELVPDADCWPR